MAMFESRANATDGRSDCAEPAIHTEDVNLYSENKNRLETKQIAKEKTPCIGCVSAETTCSGLCHAFGIRQPRPENENLPSGGMP